LFLNIFKECIKLTKSEVIDAVAEKMSISKVEAEKFINANDEVIIEGLKKESEILVSLMLFTEQRDLV